MEQILLVLGGALIAGGMFLIGIGVGKRITLETIRDEVIREKARLEVDRAEIQRLVLGQTRGFMDAKGQLIKLHTPSALKNMPTEELEEIARDRGLLTMQSLGERGDLITAISGHQKQFVRAQRSVNTHNLPGDDQR